MSYQSNPQLWRKIPKQERHKNFGEKPCLLKVTLPAKANKDSYKLKYNVANTGKKEKDNKTCYSLSVPQQDLRVYQDSSILLLANKGSFSSLETWVTQNPTLERYDPIQIQIIYYKSVSYIWYFLNWKWYKQTTNYFTQKKIIQLNLTLLKYLKYYML